jgi:Asp-tRNA(Asn)/Glu-tRNA(Gln) amidotransferase A subunit family amidase
VIWGQPATATIDRDLHEITISRLEELYATRKYTVTQVTQWYLHRIGRFNGLYKAIQHVDQDGALATAASEDNAAKKGGANFKKPALWGVPIVIKGNTSIKGLITSDGWRGYLIPGHELIAPADAPVVAKLRAAGAVIIGQTNMPDFAASDTNMSTAFGRTGNAYDWRFSPGGSSGGTVTAVTANFAVFGTGTDTSNSIRMPSGTSSVVGLLPTRGLVSIAGIHPLDWLLDNTGPIARNVTDVAIALGVMAGEERIDFRTLGSAAKAQPGPYTKYLKADALRGKRFGVPAFIVEESNAAGSAAMYEGPLLTPETRAMFTKAMDGLRSAGATVVVDPSILPSSFLELTNAIDTRPYRQEGTDNFLRDFGPAQYHSAAEYQKAVGAPLPPVINNPGQPGRVLENDPAAESTFWGPQRIALDLYEKTLERLHLDGYVYPAIQMPPNDETIPQPGGGPSAGPHSRTGWVNRIGVPAVVVPAGFYESGLPFGIEISTRRWKDGDLLGWAFAFEQKGKYRKSPVLKEQ